MYAISHIVYRETYCMHMKIINDINTSTDIMFGHAHNIKQRYQPWSSHSYGLQ